MFGSARRVCGSPRLFPVIDYTLRSEVVRIVSEKDGRRPPGRFNGKDEAHVRPTDLLAVNVSGRQCHLFLTTYGGRAITFLVYTRENDVEVLPLRFDAARHEDDTLMKCTFAAKDKLLVVDDICSAAPTHDRVLDMHALVHDSHTPDPYLFPMRVVVRKIHALADVGDVKKFIATAPFAVHSVSIITSNGPNGTSTEKRILRSDQGGARFVSVRRPQQCMMQADVVRSSQPESYKLSVDGKRSWTFMRVKTLTDSTCLRNVFDGVPDGHAVPCIVTKDGDGWSFAGVRQAHPHN